MYSKHACRRNMSFLPLLIPSTKQCCFDSSSHCDFFLSYLTLISLPEDNDLLHLLPTEMETYLGSVMLRNTVKIQVMSNARVCFSLLYGSSFSFTEDDGGNGSQGGGCGGGSGNNNGRYGSVEKIFTFIFSLYFLLSLSKGIGISLALGYAQTVIWWSMILT